MDDKSHGQMTARVADVLSGYFDAKGYDLDVLHDHGPKKGNNVGEIVSWSRPESESGRGTALSQLDIAVVKHPEAKKVIALIEIEESEDKPKVLLGDVFAAALGNHFTFQGQSKEQRKLSVGDWTTMIVMGKGKDTPADRDRIRFLDASAENIRAAQPGNNWSVGKVVIDSFTDESDLVEELKNQIDAARKRVG